MCTNKDYKNNLISMAPFYGRNLYVSKSCATTWLKATFFVNSMKLVNE